MEEPSRNVLHNVLNGFPAVPPLHTPGASSSSPAWNTLSHAVRMLRSVAALSRDKGDA